MSKPFTTTDTTTLREAVAGAIRRIELEIRDPTYGEKADAAITVIRDALIAAAGEPGERFLYFDSGEYDGTLADWITATLTPDAAIAPIPWWMTHLPDGWGVNVRPPSWGVREWYAEVRTSTRRLYTSFAPTRDAALDAALRSALEGVTE